MKISKVGWPVGLQENQTLLEGKCLLTAHAHAWSSASRSSYLWSKKLSEYIAPGTLAAEVEKRQQL